MPRVPRYDERKVAPEKYPDVAFRAAPDAEMFGAKTAEAVQTGVTRLNDTIQARMAKDREDADKLRVQDAVNEMGLLKADLLNNVYSKKGLEAIRYTSPASKDDDDTVDRYWKEGVDKIKNNLSDSQKRLFQPYEGNTWVEIYSRMNAHAANERERHDTESTKARINILSNEIIGNIGNPKAVEVIKRDIEDAFLDKAIRDGRITENEKKNRSFSDESVNAELFKVKSEANSNVAKGLIDTGYPDKATEYLKTLTSKDIDLEEKNKLKSLAKSAKDKLIEDAKTQAKINENNATFEAGNLFVQKRLTLQNIDAMVKAGTMKPETATALQTALFTKKMGGPLKDKTWKEFSKTKAVFGSGRDKISDKGSYFINTIKNLKNGEDATEVVLSAFRAYSENLITNEDLGFVVRTAQEAHNKKKISFIGRELLQASKYGTPAVEATIEKMMKKNMEVGFTEGDIGKTIDWGGRKVKILSVDDPFNPQIEEVK